MDVFRETVQRKLLIYFNAILIYLMFYELMVSRKCIFFVLKYTNQGCLYIPST